MIVVLRIIGIDVPLSFYDLFSDDRGLNVILKDMTYE